MPAIFTEDTFEQAVIELFETMGYTHIYAPDLDREDTTRPLLDDRWRPACGGSMGPCRGRPSTRRC